MRQKPLDGLRFSIDLCFGFPSEFSRTGFAKKVVSIRTLVHACYEDEGRFRSTKFIRVGWSSIRTRRLLRAMPRFPCRPKRSRGGRLNARGRVVALLVHAFPRPPRG